MYVVCRPYSSLSGTSARCRFCTRLLFLAARQSKKKRMTNARHVCTLAPAGAIVLCSLHDVSQWHSVAASVAARLYCCCCCCQRYSGARTRAAATTSVKERGGGITTVRQIEPAPNLAVRPCSRAIRRTGQRPIIAARSLDGPSVRPRPGRRHRRAPRTKWHPGKSAESWMEQGYQPAGDAPPTDRPTDRPCGADRQRTEAE